MPLKNLRLYHFRNFTSLEINFASGTNLILGKNAQGKTSLVEAIYFLSALKSFRTSKNANLIKFESLQASVAAEIENDEVNFHQAIVFGKDSKELLINDSKKTLADFYGRWQAVSFTPDDLEIIKGSPEVRRSLADKLIADLDSNKIITLKKYAQAIKNKNSLLKNNAARKELISWTEVIIPLALEITRNRLQALELLTLRAAQNIEMISEKKEEIKLSLNSDLIADTGSVISLDAAQQLYFSKLEQEQILRRSLIGPHLDDIKILLNDNDARISASQGQSRSLALALKLAIFNLIAEKKQRKPALILDDFDAEFDSERLERMCEIIKKLDTQVFITSTNLSLKGLFQNANLGMFELENGILKTIS